MDLRGSSRAMLETPAGSTCAGLFPESFTSNSIYPGWFPAENYCEMSGVTVQDVGGRRGNIVTSLDTNDWMAYGVFVPRNGWYVPSYRVEGTAGQFQLEWLGSTDVQQGRLAFQNITATSPSAVTTASGLTLQTLVGEDMVYLPQGAHSLALKVLQGGSWTLDWWLLKSSQQHGCADSTPITIPARILADSACMYNGMLLQESSEDTTSNFGWIDAGDWLALHVTVPTAGTYQMSYRIASPSGEGSLAVELFADDAGQSSSMVGTLSSFPSTGDWQSWTTVQHTVSLPAGTHLIMIHATAPGWNLRFVEIALPSSSATFFPTTRTPTTPAPVVTAPPPTAPVPPPTPAPVPNTPPTSPTTNGNGNFFEVNGFVQAQGKQILDGNGNNLILKGMGFGGWLLQEPYMMLAGEAAPNGQYQLFQHVIDVVGQDNFELYRKAWLDNWCTADDIAELKRSGFNSVRLPLHYNLFTLPIEQEPVSGQNTWLQDGFDRLDSFVQWCKQEGIYVILDLHAAPGGQGRNAAISDYDSTKPSLFESTANQDKMVALWVQLASRYKDETVIAGYDILNEPNWNFVEGGHPNGCSETANVPLKALYDRTIQAIRQVDTSHLIMIEGNCFANNHAGLWPFSDDNVALSFHRYWIENTVASIQQFLDWRNQYNVPLWMGESGENSYLWFGEAVQLLESNNIGWAWWTWKKLQSDSGAYSINPPSGYQDLVNYWTNGGTKPSVDYAFNIMMQLAENALLANAVRNDAVITALTDPVRTCTGATAVTLSSSSSTRIEAEDYCSVMGFLSEQCTDVGGGYDFGWTDAGDYMSFRINVPASGNYQVSYRIASLDGDGGLYLTNRGTGAVLGSISSLPATGGWQSWQTVSHTVVLSAGDQVISMVATDSGWNVNWLEIAPQ